MNQFDKDTVTQHVTSFYRLLPFNLEETVEQACRTIRGGNQVAESYPYLDCILRGTMNNQVLDVGSGTGWFVNTVAYYYGMNVVGVDLCEPAILQAKEVSEKLSVSDKVTYYNADLFSIQTIQFNATNQFYLVNSLGVLHHTYHCYHALLSIINLVENYGFIHLGLYHKYGRKPFLELFQEYRKEWEGSSSSSHRAQIEEEAFSIYKELNSYMSDETILRSWFRDQVFHPHESHHTLEEVYSWLTGSGFQCISTSINKFEKVDEWDVLFEEEKKMHDLSYKRNYEEKKYFPGFFVILAQKIPGACERS